MTSWRDIKDGYGLTLVPKTIDASCQICGATRAVYTTENLNASHKEYRAMTDRIRANSYCKIHAIWYFGD